MIIRKIADWKFSKPILYAFYLIIGLLVFLWALSLVIEGEGTDYIGIPFLYNLSPIGIVIFFIALIIVGIYAGYRIWENFREEQLLKKKYGQKE